MENIQSGYTHNTLLAFKHVKGDLLDNASKKHGDAW